MVHPRAFVEAASETPVVEHGPFAAADVAAQSSAVDPADRHATVRYGEITNAEPRTPTHRLPTHEEPSVGPTVQVDPLISMPSAPPADVGTVKVPRMSRDAWNNPEPPYEGFFEGRPPPPDFFEFVELEDGTRLPWLTRPAVRGRSPAATLALAIVVSVLTIAAAMIVLGAFGCQAAQAGVAPRPTDPATVLQSDEARAKTMPERVSR